jgi:nicotinamidase/pyrazinamidase
LGERVTDVDVVGLATDYCVKATALDSVRTRNTRVLLGMCAGVNPETTKLAVGEMSNAGVTCIEDDGSSNEQA